MTTVEDRPGRRAPSQPGAPTSPDRPIGFGRIQRKEDPRFIRGKGHYVDDIVLPGMLHGAILRSPMAHARLVSIDTTEALAHPKVHAVITGKDLEGLNLAWAPTLSADVHGRAGHRQGALPGPGGRLRRRRGPLLRPRRPGADRRRVRGPAGRDRRPHARWTPDAAVIRDDLDGRTDNHIFDWEAGDAAETDAVFAAADVVVSAGGRLPAGAPGADGDLRRGRRLRRRSTAS